MPMYYYNFIGVEKLQVVGVHSVKEWMPECVRETKSMRRFVVKQLFDEVKQLNVLLVRL